ncbi:collagen alpha-1(I) chain-like [Bos javanicus]|uniref:collagen alpha-1(I) chain-like n=1 Tax=Bos javanicus TaxID=9906 RepID=UPI002AA67E9B|nr:collagen alpha-1(I) chain-like [Bos javanicus]
MGSLEVRAWGRAGKTGPSPVSPVRARGSRPGRAPWRTPAEPQVSARRGGGNQSWFSGCRGPLPAPPTVPRAPKRAHPTPEARGAPWLGQDARTQARPAAQRLAPPPPPRSGPLPAPCPLSAPTHRHRLRGKFGGAAAATARLLGARWRRGAEGADPEAGRRGRSRAEGAARREAGRRRPGPRACRSPPPAPRASAAPAPGGGVRGATSLPPHPPRGPSGAPGAPCFGPGSGARLLGWGKEPQKLGENSLRPRTPEGAHRGYDMWRQMGTWVLREQQQPQSNTAQEGCTRRLHPFAV